MRRRIGQFVRLWRTEGPRAALRLARWRVAQRIGRLLVGGDLAALQSALGEAAVQRHLLEARFADLTAMMVGVRERTQAVGREVMTLRERTAALEAARKADGARHDHALRAIESRLDAAVDELTRADRVARDTIDWLERTAIELDARSLRHGRSIAWLAARHGAAVSVPASDAEVLVSVVMPVWNRAGLVGDAIASVQAQRHRRWELIVVDDGSTDDLAAALARVADDARIRVLRQAHGGQGRARNTGVAASRGEIIAYLDTDNRWDAGYLDAVLAAFAFPDVQSVYLGQVVHDRSTGDAFIRGEAFDADVLRGGNYIDLNVFSHRRAMVERAGGFDETLERLVDWDLILRYTAASTPVTVPVVGGDYVLGLPDQVSVRASYSLSFHRVRRKLERPLPHPVRVLFASWHYPQLTESHVRAELTTMRRRGVDVAVWSSEAPAAPFASEVAVYEGALADAIARHRPHVVHVHGLDLASRVVTAVAECGVPLTVRGDGDDFTPERVTMLGAQPAVRTIYLFPHLAPAWSPAGSKIRPLPVVFDAERYHPGAVKEPRLVVRVAAGVPTSDLEAFIRIAVRCPDHRFVLAVAHAVRFEPFVDRLRAFNVAHGSPVELHVDLPHDDVAALVSAAAISLHTHALDAPFGMPISIVEAMATGAWVLARRCPAAMAYVGEAGCGWDTEDEAVARIVETTTWDDERWATVRRASVERAFARYADTRVLDAVLDDWIVLAREVGG
ncbi:MAG TPA: glycosyltransferase [Candidatus Binatia bacterium]|nr:glycosyltransferase [Candidatus Binatia bacterium]